MAPLQLLQASACTAPWARKRHAPRGFGILMRKSRGKCRIVFEPLVSVRVSNPCYVSLLPKFFFNRAKDRVM